MGFTSRTHDMLAVVRAYEGRSPGCALGKFLPALERVDGTPSRKGLGAGFVKAWRAAGVDPKFRAAQDGERDRTYFDPAVSAGVADGVGALGQFMYYDAIVMHGGGEDADGFWAIRANAMRSARTPAEGGDERAYLGAFLAARKVAMLHERGHRDTSRVDTMQARFLAEGKLGLELPLVFAVYGDGYEIR